jgi:hypothetical protein
MRRITRTRSLLLGAVLAAAALAAPGSGSAATVKTVNGTVGPGFTIGLTMNGKKVTRVKAGTAYRFVISDRSSIHNFHLSGRGFNRVLTGVEYTRDEELRAEAEKGELQLRVRPALRVDARRLRGLLSCDYRGARLRPRPPSIVVRSLF